MSRVSVFWETFGECIREIVVGRAVNETDNARGYVVLDVVHLDVNVVVPVGLPRKKGS